MKRVRIGTLTWMAVLVLAPTARGQTPFDELTGVLRVTEDEASIEANGRVRLIFVPPQTGVDVDELLAQTAANVRMLDGQRVHATGELQGDILWNARVEEEQTPVEAFVPVPGPGGDFDELVGTLQVTGSEASIDGTRLAFVPPQTGVDVDELLAQTAANVRPLAGQQVRATGQLQGDILWNAVVKKAAEEEDVEVVEEEVVEEVEEEMVEEVQEDVVEPQEQAEQQVEEETDMVPEEE
ncbi:MAG: hypothetical protein ACREMD_11145 [Gemmatimonadota bacterium]